MVNRSIFLQITMTLVLLLLVQSGVVFAYVSDEELAKLQERAKKEGWTFTIGHTWATEQPDEVLFGFKEIEERMIEDIRERVTLGERVTLPSTFDWRDVNDFCFVTPIRRQMCGDCWAFSAMGALESFILSRDLNLNPEELDLSEQWLISCCEWGDCSGGNATIALDYCTRDPNDDYEDECGDDGAVLEEDCPYTGTNSDCNCPYDHPYWINDNYYVGGGAYPTVEEIKEAIYTNGPVVCAVYSSGPAFQGYTGGVFNAYEAGWPDHQVVLVGWDDDPEDGGPNCPGVWILRNSWGSNNWGEDGYMRIEYGRWIEERWIRCNMVGYASYYIEFPNIFETTKFYIKNDLGNTVAWFGNYGYSGNLGDLVLKGTLTSGGTCNAPSGSFIVADSNDETVAYIDPNGNMCIEGSYDEECESCEPQEDAFIIRNSSGVNVSYIDFQGNLCLKGKLYENSIP